MIVINILHLFKPLSLPKLFSAFATGWMYSKRGRSLRFFLFLRSLCNFKNSPCPSIHSFCLLIKLFHNDLYSYVLSSNSLLIIISNASNLLRSSAVICPSFASICTPDIHLQLISIYRSKDNGNILIFHKRFKFVP